MITVKTFVFNPIQENTYVVHDETKQAVIIDAGCLSKEEKDSLSGYIKGNNLEIKYLLNTHCHFDHVFGISFLKKTYDISLAAHKEDEFILNNANEHASLFGFNNIEIPSIDIFLADGDEIHFGNTSLKVLHVPGHSPGGLSFYIAAEKTVFTGDSLFFNSVGRTDLPYGSPEVLINSINKKLMCLPDDVTVYPGHDIKTTIANERKTNPFL